ncbi:MAG: signal peptide peptidase SppA [Parcubacteria group bacterium]|nr:signal peptide peptidase SppA [Parcubacteria group bacterium]
MTTPNEAKKKRNYLAWIFGCLGVFVLVGSLVANLVLSIVLLSADYSQTTSYASAYNENCLEGTCENANKIVVIDVSGTLLFDDGATSLFNPMAPTVESIGRQLDQAVDDPDVQAVILNVNSPGGSVTASDYLYNKVVKARESGLVVTTYIKDIGASGAYYMAAPSDAIMANPTALTGSIGVIISTLNYEGLYEKLGLKSVVYKSGASKDLLSSTREQTEDEKKILQGIVDETQERFLGIVKENRPVTDGNVATISDGRIFTAQQAKEVNLIDSTGYFQDALTKTAETANLSEYSVVQYEQPFTFGQLFGGLGALVKNDVVGELKKEIYSNRSEVLYLWQ